MISGAQKARPAACISVVEDDSPRRKRRHAYVCRDQIDIKYRYAVLPAFFFRKPADRLLDLMRIAAAVAHTDRRICRRPSVCWGRDLEVAIPGSDPEFWSSEVSEGLVRLLDLLSGDSWNFVFHKAAARLQVPSQGYLQFPPMGELALAYSSGLDSFSSARLVASGAVPLSDGLQRKRDLVLVTTGRDINAELRQSLTEFGYHIRQVSVPFSIRRSGEGFELREPSFRTRAFAFQTMTAVAAAQSEGDIVVIPESGQGSLGPWLTVTGQETPDIRTHPIFTSALAKLLEPILGRRIRFEHPHLWDTKGQTLGRLVAQRLQSGWQETFSCAVQVRHQQTPGRRLQCGLCPNCLLRKQSLWAAGLDEPDNEYDYKSGPSKDEIHDSNENKRLHRRVAEGLLPLIEFAQLKSVPLLAKTADRQIARFATTVQADTNDLFPRNVQLQYEAMAKRTVDVVNCHRHELVNYLSRRPSGSLIRQLGTVLL